jgi:hypothetical protein
VLSAGVRGLGDERELRVERHREVTDEALEELVADRARGPFGDSAKQVPVYVRRHEPANRC